MGGGSGGHVTPVVAVLAELRRRNASHEMRFWCDKKFGVQARRIMKEFDPAMIVSTVTAGKLRRYHHLTLWQHLLIPSVLFPNLLDVVKVVAGFVQSFCKLIVWRPDVIFLKGGYVCLPVGWAARALRIPYVIHDSDAHPGLTNRLLAPGAVRVATGAPLKYYPYPAEKSHYVGIPVGREFRPYSAKERRAIKLSLGFVADRPLVVITGGGLGAKRINDAVAATLPQLIDVASVMLVSGVGQYNELRKQLGDNTDTFQLTAFVSDGMARLLGAADVVVARAGATSLLELAAVGAPTILVPNGRLTGGHQLKNAKVYADADAVHLADEEQFKDNPQLLSEAITALVRSPDRQNQLRQAVCTFAKPHAARDTANLILQAYKKQSLK